MASRIEYRNSPAQVMKRAVDAVRAGLEAAAQEWHREVMPTHFTVEGGRRYAYQPRSGDDEPPRLPNPAYLANRALGFVRSKPTISNPHYTWVKRRQMRHNKPLVWSGASEAAAKASVKISSRKTTADASTVEGWAVMPDLPRYFYQRLKAGWYRRPNAGDGKGMMHIEHDTPDKVAELTRVLPSEEAQFAVTVQRVAMERMGQAVVAEDSPHVVTA